MSIKDVVKLEANITGKINLKLCDSVSGDILQEVEKNNLVFDDYVQKRLGYSALFHLLGKFGKSLTSQSMELAPYQSFQSHEVGALFNHVMLSRNGTPNEAIESHVPSLPFVGWANNTTAYSGDSTQQGTINIAESTINPSENRFRLVYDFPTHCANGEINSVLLYSADMNTNTGSTSAMGGIALPNMTNEFADILGAKISNNNKELVTDHSSVFSYSFMNVYPLDENYFISIGAHTGIGGISVVRVSKATGLTDKTMKLSRSASMDLDMQNKGFVCHKFGDKLCFSGKHTSTGTMFGDVLLSTIKSLFDQASTPAYVRPTRADTGVLTTASDAAFGTWFETDELVWVWGGFDGTDSVTGVVRNRILYKMNWVTKEVLERATANFSAPTGTYDKILVIRHALTVFELVVLTNAYPGTARVASHFIDISETDVVLRPKNWCQHGGASSAIVAPISHRDGEACITGFYTFSTMSNRMSFDKGATLPLFELPKASIMSRAVLPSPLVKTNTKTLKVTYDISFPPSILG
jgi:hypothetical protein